MKNDVTLIADTPKVHVRAVLHGEKEVELLAESRFSVDPSTLDYDLQSIFRYLMEDGTLVRQEDTYVMLKPFSFLSLETAQITLRRIDLNAGLHRVS
jgi:hypothetical protein